MTDTRIERALTRYHEWLEGRHEDDYDDEREMAEAALNKMAAILKELGLAS